MITLIRFDFILNIGIIIYIIKRDKVGITMVRKIEMENLTCSNCISKVERRTTRLPYVNSASFNYAKQILLVDFKDDYDEVQALKEIKEIVDILEDNIITHYYEEKVIIKKVNFFKEYKYVLFGMLLITITFFAFRIFPIINTIFGTNLTRLNDTLKTIFYWVGYLFLISKLLKQQIRGIRKFNIFDENTLMIIATFAAMFIGKYEESVAVVILYSVGEYLQTRAVQHSKNEISSLVNLKVDFANVVVGNKIVVKDPALIKVGDELVIKNGERIAIDGRVISGSTSLNTSELTGEAKLKTVNVIKLAILSIMLCVGNSYADENAVKYDYHSNGKISIKWSYSKITGKLNGVSKVYDQRAHE